MVDISKFEQQLLTKKAQTKNDRPKVKVKGKKTDVCDGVPSTAVLILFEKGK